MFDQARHPRRLAVVLVMFAFSMAATPAQSQEASLSGFVTDASDGQPLEGATAALSDPADEDGSLERTFTLSAASLTLQGSVINTYDRRNLFYLDMFTMQRVDQLPIVPSFGIRVSFN